ncbi:MAG: hypothetical protein AB8B77_00725 [Alphaproteobacteria bacterium]
MEEFKLWYDDQMVIFVIQIAFSIWATIEIAKALYKSTSQIRVRILSKISPKRAANILNVLNLDIKETLHLKYKENFIFFFIELFSRGVMWAFIFFVSMIQPAPFDIFSLLFALRAILVFRQLSRSARFLENPLKYIKGYLEKYENIKEFLPEEVKHKLDIDIQENLNLFQALDEEYALKRNLDFKGIVESSMSSK